MLFGSAVVVAMMVAGSGESKHQRSSTHLWLEADARPTPLVILTPKPPLELKSFKVMGATGLGLFVPIVEDVGLGVAVSQYRVSTTQRVAQVVFALRFRF